MKSIGFCVEVKKIANIYVLEDDESIRELVCYTLNTAGFKTVPFKNSKKLFKAIEDNLPDLFLLDIILEGSSGETGHNVLKKLKNDQRTTNIPVIFLTSKSNEIDKAFGLDLGADDYITKPFGVLEFIARVKAVLRRFKQETRDVLINENEHVFFDIKIDTKSKVVWKGKESIKLTFKEYELLLYLYQNIGIVISRDQLLDVVWGVASGVYNDEFFGDKRTVDVHIRALRQKLGDNADNPKYIKTMRGFGYMLIKEGE